jgi:type I site-specific restriction endonuclease
MPRRISEELARKEMIDPQLEKAGWYLRAKINQISCDQKVNALRGMG